MRWLKNTTKKTHCSDNVKGDEKKDMKANTEEKVITFISYLTLILFAIVCVVPLLMIIVVSFTSEESIAQHGFSLIPSEISFEAYKMLFANPTQLLDAYKVTIIITVTGTFLGILCSSQMAYAVSRRNFVLQRILSFMLYFTMLFNGGLVPTYILMTRYLHLKNSLWAVILPMMVSPWNIFMLRTFMKSVPDSLIESAKLDGASEFRIFYQIIVPLSMGGIATVAITMAIGYWNDWYQNMLYISDTDKYSLQYLLQTLLGKVEFLKLANKSGQAVDMKVPEDGLRMATCVMAVGPMAFLFFFVQKYFVRGITIGAVKG